MVRVMRPPPAVQHNAEFPFRNVQLDEVEPCAMSFCLFVSWFMCGFVRKCKSITVAQSSLYKLSRSFAIRTRRAHITMAPSISISLFISS